MMFLVSCKTTEVIEKTVHHVPEIDFPAFPKLGEYEKTNDGRIIVDEEYFRKLLIFKERYKSAVSEYNEKKDKLEAKNEL